MSGERWEASLDSAGPMGGGGGRTASPRDPPSLPPVAPDLGPSLAERC